MLKILTGFVALFVLGGVLGASLQHRRAGGGVGRGAWRQAWIERWADRNFEQVSKRFDLRPEQLAALQPVQDEMKAELADLQRETARRAAQIIAKQRRAIWQQLDESQRQKHRSWLRQSRSDASPAAQARSMRLP